MAAARDQAARILRTEEDSADDGSARDSSPVSVESLRSLLSEEAVARRQEAPAPEKPATDSPGGAPAAAANPAAPKSGKRRLVLIGVGLLENVHIGRA